MNEVLAETNFNHETDSNVIENKQAKVEKPKASDESRFNAVEINRTDKNSKFVLAINVKYPQLKKAANLHEKQFNQYIKKRVNEQIFDFRKFLIEKNKEVKSNSKDEYEINLDYDIEYVSDKLISVLMNWNGYSGYLNMDYFPSTIIYDLAKGKEIELKNLFRQNSNYLEKLSELSIKRLNRICLSCPCKDGTNAGEPLPEGKVNDQIPNGMFGLSESVSPKEENFSNWSFTADGIKITFNEYQVGPGCIGIINIVIPFSDFQPILRKDLNFN